MADRPPAQRRQPSDAVYAPPAVVEMLRLRKLDYGRHWASMRSGETRGLARELDGLIRDSDIPLTRIEQHLLVAARENGIPVQAVGHLVQQRLILFRKHLLAMQGRRLRRAAQRTVDVARAKLKWIEGRNHVSVLRAIQRRREPLQRLDPRMAHAWRCMPDVLVARLREATPEVSFSCELDAKDQQLVSTWPRDRRRQVDEETNRLESARRAEKAALAYYSDLGLRVEDVSIGQLEGGAKGHESHDIRAEDRPLDVKNVRCTRADRFAEHYWKKHKRYRHKEVAIVGVVSMENLGASIVTGELQHSELDAFRHRTTSYPDGPRVSLELGDLSGFVPGWLFEYPKLHYGSMPDWDVLRRWLEISDALRCEVAPWILALGASRIRSGSNIPAASGVTRSIGRFFQHFPVSRRSTFWFVLCYLLSNSADPQARDDLIEHMFPNRPAGGAPAHRLLKEGQFPLALFDPREYIWNLIHTLSQMIRSNRDLLSAASAYRLRGAGILQARIDNSWYTVLAYCGNCGKWPIYLGEPDIEDGEAIVEAGACRSCPCNRRRLVCDDCGGCAEPGCQGVTYATPVEAQNAAREFPGWRQVERTLQPPRLNEPPMNYPRTG